MVSLEQLAERHAETFLYLIEEKNDRYGYLGADWDDDIAGVYESGRPLMLRVYFEDLVYSTDVILEAGTWTPADYMEQTCLHSAQAALDYYADGSISALLPEGLELDS